MGFVVMETRQSRQGVVRWREDRCRWRTPGCTSYVAGALVRNPVDGCRGAVHCMVSGWMVPALEHDLPCNS